MVKVAITQPNFLPWMGYFDMAMRVDIFVLLDDVQYIKREWMNRNKLHLQNEPYWQWLVVPVEKGEVGKLINQTRLLIDKSFRRKFDSKFLHAYGKAPYFDQYYPELKMLMENEYDSLAHLNVEIIRRIYKWLRLPCNFILSSSLEAEGSKSHKLFNICQKLNATHYLANNGSSGYIDPDLFTSNGIRFQYQNFDHPTYTGAYGNVQPTYLSIVDCLFFHGVYTADLIRSSHQDFKAHSVI